jgi:hypothetical protein
MTIKRMINKPKSIKRDPFANLSDFEDKGSANQTLVHVPNNLLNIPSYGQN